MRNKIDNFLSMMLTNELAKKHREKILLLVDLTMVVIAYGFATILKTNLDLKDVYLDFITSIWLVPVIIIVHIITLTKYNVHRSLWKYFGSKEVKNISYALIASAMILTFYGYIVSRSKSVVTYIFIAEMITLLLIFAVRFLYRALRETSVGYEKIVNVLIVGAGDAGYIMLKDLSVINNGEKVVGFLDDRKVNKIVAGHKVLGQIKDLKRICDLYNVKKIYIAMPSVDLKSQKSIFEACQDLQIETKVMKKTDHRFGGSKGKAMQYPVENVSIDDLLGRGEVHLNNEEIESYIAGKNILITGAGGSIGSELCRQIIKHSPYSIIMLDLNENSMYMLELELKASSYAREVKIYSYVASVRDEIEVNRILEKREIDVVYHAAAHKHVPLMESRPQEAFKNNVMGTKIMVEACIKNKVGQFVLISTDKAVNPTNVMGASKRMCEMILQSNGDNGVTKLGAVRFGNVLGSNGSVIPIFNEQIKNGGPVEVTHEDITRYFMTIPEAAQLVLQAGFYADKGAIFILDMGNPVRIYDLATKLIQLSGYQPNQDIDIIVKGLRPGEKMYEELSLESEIIGETDNKLIYMNHPQVIDKNKLDRDIKELSNLINDNAKKRVIKDYFLSCIK